MTDGAVRILRLTAPPLFPGGGRKALMGIKQVEVLLGGMSHTVQVNDADKNFEIRVSPGSSEPKVKSPANKSRAPQNKAAKPAAKKPAAKPAVEAASDPDASE